jgi:hypothetical protein
MKIGWGWKVALLYSSFVLLMVTLVVASSRQKFDLVSNDYYKDEIAYQKVLDAGKNQAALSSPITVYANDHAVIVDLPKEFTDKIISGDIKFYSPVNKEWDRNYKIDAPNNTIAIPRSELRNTRYVVKIQLTVDGREYYQESELQLNR